MSSKPFTVSLLQQKPINRHFFRCCSASESAAMDFRRLGYLVGCFVLGLVGLLKEVSGKNGMHNKCKYPAIYNFGDSNSDTGTVAAAFTMILPPNGQSFSGKLPKRSCDGRLTIDFISEELKLPYLSAYLDSIGTSYRHGANFAAGGATIRNNGTLPSPFHLAMQVSQFIQFKSWTTTLYKYNQIARNKTFAPYRLPRPEDFSKALYTIDIGLNDLAFGFINTSEEQVRASIPDMLNQLSQALQQLYKEEARVFWIHNTGPLGCLPRQVSKYQPKGSALDSNGCIKSHNEIAQQFNKQLKNHVLQLRETFPVAKFVYVDVYTAKYELSSNAKKLGFVDPMDFCCGTGNSTFNDCGVQSIIKGEEDDKRCTNPSKHISWDGIHYSEAANRYTAKRILSGTLSHPQVPIGEACNVKATDHS